METRFLAVAGLLLALLAARIFAPFLGTLLAAASVALVLAPLQKTWVGRSPRHPAAAAAALARNPPAAAGSSISASAARMASAPVWRPRGTSTASARRR